MEPFTILCSTCQSRIRVRNPAMIGQIVNCPKCESMLMIALPQKVEFESPGNAGVDSMAMTKDGISPSLLPTPQSVQTEPQRAMGEASNADEFDDAIDWTEQPDSDPGTSWNPTDAPLVPTADWTSESTARKRQYLLVGFLGVSGMALAGVLFFVFLQWYSAPKDSKDVLAMNNNPAQIDNPALNDNGAAADPTSLDNSPQDAVDGAEPPADPPLPEIGPDSPPAELPGLGPTSINPEQPTPTPEQVVPSEPNAGADTEPVETVGPAEPTPQPETPAQVDVPKALARFQGLLSRDLELSVPDPTVLPTEAPVTADELGIADASDAASVPVVNWQERSKLIVPGIIIGDRTLSHSVNIWALISGVPTVVDIDSLAAAGIDRNRSLAIQQMKPMDLAEMAGVFAQAAQLDVQPEENRFLRLRARTDDIVAKLPLSISVDDLIANDEDALWLEASLATLFPGSPDGWKVVDKKLEVDLNRTDLVTWFSVVRILENWRSQAGKATQLPDYAPEFFAQPLLDARVVKSLDTPLKTPTQRAQPVAQMLPALCNEVGMKGWIDWPELGGNGLGPSTTATVITHARPLRRVLSDLAREFHLVVALVDEESLWITSARAYRSQSRVFVMPSQGRTAAQWSQDLREYTPTGPRGIGKIDAMLTPDGNFLIVRCCRPLIRF